MKLAKVIGRATLSKMDASLAGGRLIILSPLEKSHIADMGEEQGVNPLVPNLVAYDPLGVGKDDVVGYVDGAEATAQFDRPIPIDACVVAIAEKFTYRPNVK